MWSSYTIKSDLQDVLVSQWENMSKFKCKYTQVKAGSEHLQSLHISLLDIYIWGNVFLMGIQQQERKHTKLPDPQEANTYLFCKYFQYLREDTRNL